MTVLIVHISVALASLIMATILWAVPSKAKLYVTYVLSAMTLMSGILLTISAPAYLVRACAMGIVFLSVVISVTVVARRKLAYART